LRISGSHLDPSFFFIISLQVEMKWSCILLQWVLEYVNSALAVINVSKFCTYPLYILSSSQQLRQPWTLEGGRDTIRFNILYCYTFGSNFFKANRRRRSKMENVCVWWWVCSKDFWRSSKFTYSLYYKKIVVTVKQDGRVVPTVFKQ